MEEDEKVRREGGVGWERETRALYFPSGTYKATGAILMSFRGPLKNAIKLTNESTRSPSPLTRGAGAEIAFNSKNVPGVNFRLYLSPEFAVLSFLLETLQ